MTNLLMAFTILLTMVIADKSAPGSGGKRNHLNQGLRSITDMKLLSKDYYFIDDDTIEWEADNPDTTFITQITVTDKLGAGLSAKPYIRRGGEHCNAVQIAFTRKPFQFVDVKVEIWGYMLQPGETIEEYTDDEVHMGVDSKSDD